MAFVCQGLKATIAMNLLHSKVVCREFVCGYHGNDSTKTLKNNVNLFVMIRTCFLPIIMEIDKIALK